MEGTDGLEIWLAHDEVLGKDVSLHFIPEAVHKDNRALQELRVDIKRNRQLIHPNIVRVYDLVEEPDWVAVSMDTFEGESLAQRLDRQAGKAIKSDEVKALVEQLAQTVEEAHKINVLHRDLTPSNVFLTPSGKLLVANFGISRTIRDAQARAGGGEIPGTAYESPQLLDGKTPARTDDVYSLGAVVFATLTGQPPFVGKDIAQQVRNGVTPVTLAALRKEDLSVPTNWQTIVAACLDKNPEARPQTAAEVARRLTTVSEPAPTPAPVPAKSTAVETAPKAAAATVVESAKTASEPATVLKPAEPVAKEPKKEIVVTKPAAPSPPPKSPERPLSTDFAPRLYPEESRFPVVGLAAAAAVILIIAIIYHFATSGKPSANSNAAEQEPEKAELRALSQATPAVIPPTPETGSPIVQTTAPTVVAPAQSATAKVVGEKTAALEKVKLAAQSAEKAHTDLLKQQQLAEANLADVQKVIDEKTKAAQPLKKAAEEAAAQRMKLEQEQKAAEAAALEAQKIAAEKVRLAEESAKAVAELEKKNMEKMTAPQQVEGEIAALQKTLTEKQQVVADGAKAVTQAEAARQQQIAVVTEYEREIEQIKSSDLMAQQQRAAAEAERAKLDDELAEMQRAFKERMADLENKRKMLENPTATTPASRPPQTPAATTPPPAMTPRAATPAASIKAATPEPMKVASIPATPAVPPPSTPAPAATAGGNSLGMKFAPVGDVEFCIWQTRIKDFEVFAKAVNLRSTSWKGPGFKQGPDHPVVNVSWQEAIAFCKWLTDKERKDNVLPANQFYRLPSDLEWSKAVGLPEEPGKTPEVRDMSVADVYPWGTQWPPPPGSGNYTGEETGSDVAIKGYDDGFAWTSPVGSFPPNKFGLYDMGGNVWQWCMDTWNAESKAKVLRGASWYNGALKLSLLSSCRVHAAPDSSTDNYGFRIIRASEAGKPGKR